MNFTYFILIIIFSIMTNSFIKTLGKYNSKYFSIASLIDNSEQIVSNKIGVVILLVPPILFFSMLYLFFDDWRISFIYILQTMIFMFYPAIIYPEKVLEYKYYQHKNLVFLLYLLYILLIIAFCVVLKMVIDFVKINIDSILPFAQKINLLYVSQPEIIKDLIIPSLIIPIIFAIGKFFIRKMIKTL